MDNQGLLFSKDKKDEEAPKGFERFFKKKKERDADSKEATTKDTDDKKDKEESQA